MATQKENAILESYFDPSSMPEAGKRPQFLVVMGIPCSGKTRLRREKYPDGYVVVDAGEIFMELSSGAAGLHQATILEWPAAPLLPFPGPFEGALQRLGPKIVERAIREGRNLLTEIIGDQYEPTAGMLRAMKAIGYEITVIGVDCDLETALERNKHRGMETIPAGYSQVFHLKWIAEGAKKYALLRKQDSPDRKE
jgi:hypothetical protein